MTSPKVAQNPAMWKENSSPVSMGRYKGPGLTDPEVASIMQAVYAKDGTEAKQFKAEVAKLRHDGKIKPYAICEVAKRHGVNPDDIVGFDTMEHIIGACYYDDMMVPNEPAVKKAERQKKKADKELAELKERKEITPLKTVEWIWNHLDDIDVGPADCPSFGTWSLWQWVHQNQKNKDVFILKAMDRLLPSRAQLDQIEPFEDDGTDIDDLIESALNYAVDEAASEQG